MSLYLLAMLVINLFSSKYDRRVPLSQFCVKDTVLPIPRLAWWRCKFTFFFFSFPSKATAPVERINPCYLNTSRNWTCIWIISNRGSKLFVWMACTTAVIREGNPRRFYRGECDAFLRFLSLSRIFIVLVSLFPVGLWRV